LNTPDRTTGHGARLRLRQGRPLPATRRRLRRAPEAPAHPAHAAQTGSHPGARAGGRGTSPPRVRAGEPRMEDLADAANVSIGLIYDHFGSKDGVGLALPSARSTDSPTTSTKRGPRLLAHAARDDRRRALPALDPGAPQRAALGGAAGVDGQPAKSDQVDEQVGRPMEAILASSRNLIEQAMADGEADPTFDPLLTPGSSGRPGTGWRAECPSRPDGLQSRRGRRMHSSRRRLANEGLTAPCLPGRPGTIPSDTRRAVAESGPAMAGRAAACLLLVVAEQHGAELVAGAQRELQVRAALGDGGGQQLAACFSRYCTVLRCRLSVSAARCSCRRTPGTPARLAQHRVVVPVGRQRAEHLAHPHPSGLQVRHISAIGPTRAASVTRCGGRAAIATFCAVMAW